MPSTKIARPKSRELSMEPQTGKYGHYTVDINRGDWRSTACLFDFVNHTQIQALNSKGKSTFESLEVMRHREYIVTLRV